MTDLFGNPTGPAQFSLFGEGEDRLQAPARPPVDHEARAREKLNRVLAKARAARTMPWDERNVRMWQTVFPQMAQWLPAEEAEQLKLEFFRELERLKAA
ncbi:hypothetical protein Q0812_02780 [Brevundimonas sp. 2R-24]|uniref:Uncharacterized protein n=1 Tax=Peiella sedimenti TaxID=3061083 RepID=A0ABT8SJU7_9CAUL|nr:hypothetical protein [Caulobacteraceae bacterium XZ-24]